VRSSVTGAPGSGADGPEVSVVMGVYDCASALSRTLDSVLSEAGLRLEVIVVDDGSTDGSGDLVDRYARTDGRVTVVHEDNRGLTQALIRGCALARGEFVARQDVGDVSLPGRLRKQRECLESRSEAVFVSCGTRVVGPGGEHLYDVLSDESEVTRALRSLDAARPRGPAHHGTVMFRRAAYEKVGGYRAEFYFAQDLDLWVRLAEVGDHAVLPEILYQAVAAPGSISGTYRREQVVLTRLIAESARRRRAGASDADVLARAAAIRPSGPPRAGRLARSRALYFIGACLGRRRDPAAMRYLLEAIRENPLHLKAWCRLLRAG